MLNGTFTMFSLVGVPKNSVVTITLVTAFEMPAALRSPIGWLLGSARLSMNYIVDWTLLAAVPSGGMPGGMVLASLSAPVGRLGYGIAVGAFPEPIGPRSAAVGITTPSSTLVVSTAAETPGDDVQKRLQDASDGSDTPASHFVKGLGKAWETTKSVGKSLLPHVIRAIDLGAGLYGFDTPAGLLRLKNTVGRGLAQAIAIENRPKITSGQSKNKIAANSATRKAKKSK
jgi:hypothetical protein